jgi:hypothetical protein
LTRRLTDTPPDFLDDPMVGAVGKVFVPALVNDLLHMHGTRTDAAALEPFRGRDQKADRNRLSLTMIAAWLLADDWFLSLRIPPRDILELLNSGIAELAAAGTAAQKFVFDPERREELVRLTLARLNYRPAGETEAQATDRLSSLSATERRRLVEASRAAEMRARAIREALVRKAAEESADKWTRE